MATIDEDDIRRADDFRKQLQERHPAYAGDRLKDQAVNEMRDNPKLEEFMSTLGLGDQAHLLSDLLNEIEASPLPNPRDDGFTHKIMRHHCEQVESACRSAGVSLRGGVSYGVSPTFDLDADRHAVPTTETSVVQVTAGLILFCSHLSKVLALSVPHDSVGGLMSLDSTPGKVLPRVESEANLKRLWFDLFGSYAYGGGPLDMEWQIVPHPYSLTRSLLLPAFELFAIAHEYGHHVVKHGAVDSLEVGGEPGAQNQEFEADLFALGLCRYIERDKKQPNVFLVSGVAPVVLLKCLELVRRTKGIFADGQLRVEGSNTHPETEERILAFDSYIDGIPPELANGFRQMRQNYCAIVEAIWNKFAPRYTRIYEDGLSSRDGRSTWLP